MKSKLVLLLAAVGCLPAVAQIPEPAPKVLMVIREQVKEGRENAHRRAEGAWPRIFQKGNVTTHYLGMTAESGRSEAWFLEPYESFASMEKERAAIMHSLAAELDAPNVADGELRTGSD